LQAVRLISGKSGNSDVLTSSLAWLDDASLPLLGAVLLTGMVAAAIGGHVFRVNQNRRDEKKAVTHLSEGQEGYIVSAVLALLALLLGFTFSLATDRFDARRILVLQHANAIGTAYLRSQLLGEPHRSRLSHLLIEYTDNLVILAKAPPKQVAPLLANDDRLMTDIWAATAAGFDSIKNIDFSSTFVDSINNLIDMDGARRAARQAHVPTTVFAVLLIYIVVAAGVLGYLLSTPRGRFAAIFLMGLLTLSLLLIIDIDRPTRGTIRESQASMEQLLKSLKSQPISVYDRWRTPSQ
jgi:hypothetical protein